MYVSTHEKYSLFLSDFNEIEFSVNIFSKNAQISNFMKIEPLGAELFRTDWQTDRRDEANGPFSQFRERA